MAIIVTIDLVDGEFFLESIPILIAIIVIIDWTL